MKDERAGSIYRGDGWFMGVLKSGGAVGLELDNGEARAVELSGQARVPHLTAFGRVYLPEDAVTEGMINQPESVAAALMRLWDEARFKNREVVLGVANQGVLVRFANFPKVPENQLAKVIRYQAQDYLPISISSVVLDHAVIGETAGEGGSLLEVLLVAAQREMLDNFLSVLSAARLRPRDIDASVLALLRVLPEESRAKTVVVVDVAYGPSKLLIAAGGVPRLARLIPVDLQDAAGLLGRPLSEVVTNGGASWPQEALLTWSESLAGEIRSSVEYYRESEAAAVDGVILSGRGARIQGLAAQLAASLELPVTVIQPLERITLTARLRDKGFAQKASEFAVSIALAQRGLEA